MWPRSGRGFSELITDAGIDRPVVLDVLIAGLQSSPGERVLRQHERDGSIRPRQVHSTDSLELVRHVAGVGDVIQSEGELALVLRDLRIGIAVALVIGREVVADANLVLAGRVDRAEMPGLPSP